MYHYAPDDPNRAHEPPHTDSEPQLLAAARAKLLAHLAEQSRAAITSNARPAMADRVVEQALELAGGSAPAGEDHTIAESLAELRRWLAARRAAQDTDPGVTYTDIGAATINDGARHFAARRVQLMTYQDLHGARRVLIKIER